jgi:protein-S-isoprenylcysteine O-methyltransferase Ste14
MNSDSAHHSNWTIAEVVFGLPFLAAVGLQFLLPETIARGIPRLIVGLVGVGLIVLSFVMISHARREFTRHQQPTDPGQPTTRIITTGLFGLSRNPLYLAAVILFLGLSLAFNLAWGLAALIISINLCHSILILPEERYLADKFGEEYRQYTESVRRWLGRK